METSRIEAKNNRLWVVSEVFYPEETSTGYYLTGLAEGLADRFDVKVLCGQPNYSKRGVRAPRHEVHRQTEIIRVGSTHLNKNVIAFRLINMLTLGASVFFQGVRRFQRGDSVMVVTTPPLMPFIVAAASLIRGSSYVLLIHDSYPEVLIAVRQLRRDALAVRAVDHFNQWLYKHARKIIVVGRDMAELVRRKTLGLSVSVVMIPNWAEVDSVVPEPRDENELLAQLGVRDKLVILHAGNIGHPTDIESIIGCFKLLNGDKRFHFVFIGSGVKRRLLEDAVRKNNFDGVTLLDPMSRDKQSRFLNACDVGLVSLIDGMLGAAMPSKTYNLMAAGKPLLALADPCSELARVIDEDEIGWHVEPGRPDALKIVLDELYEQRGLLPEMGRRARVAAIKKYSPNQIIERYAEELK